MKSLRTVLIIALLAAVILFVAGCSCATMAKMKGLDPEEECISHWKARPKEQEMAMKEEPWDPCARAPTQSRMQNYPVGNAVSIEKIAPEEIRAGQEFEYRILVKNTGDSTLNNVVISEYVPSNLTVQGSSPQHQMVGNNAQWAFESLDPEESKMITITAIGQGSGLVSTCADVTYDRPICAVMAIVESKLKLTKMIEEQALSCDRIKSEYLIENTGSGYACGVEIQDELANGLMTSRGEEKVMFTVDKLAPGESKKFEVMLDAATTGKFSSRAVAMSDTDTVESNIASVTVTEPKLLVEEAAPGEQYIGRNITYDLTVSNNGDGIARDTKLIARLPDDIEFNSASNGGKFTTQSPGQVTWNLGEIMPGESRKVTMTLKGDRPMMLESRATATAHCAQAADAVAMTVIKGIPAILMEVVDISDPIEVGNTETYVITITNQGSAIDSNIRITTILEDNMQYVSSTGPTQVSVDGRELNFGALDMLSPGERAVWKVNVRSTGAGDMRFKAIMNSDQFKRPVEETEATHFYQ